MLALLAPACTREPDARVSVLRLADRPAELGVESAVDLGDEEALARHAAAAWFDVATIDLAAGDEAAARLDGDALAPLFGPAVLGREVLLRLLPATVHREHEVVVRLADARAAEKAVLLDLEGIPDAVTLRDASRLTQSFQAAGAKLAFLERDAQDGDAGPLAARVVPGERTGSLALALLVNAGADVHGTATLRRRSPFVEDLPRCTRLVDGSSWLRRATVGMDAREAVVVVTPARIRWTCSARPAGSRLRLAVAALEDEFSPRVRLAVKTGAGTALEADVATADVEGRVAWKDFEVGADFGDEVVIEVSAADGRACGVALANARFVAPGQRKEERDVVLVSLDTVRADRLEIHGAKRPAAPHLAALAASSAVFLQAVAPAAYTLPSHASLFSGQHVDRHGVIGSGKAIDPRRVPLLAAAFRAAGYETVAFTGGGYLDPSFGFAAGFERFVLADPARGQDDERKAASAAYRRAVASLPSPTWSREELLRTIAGPRERPLFLFVHTYAAHNYAAPDADLEAIGAEPEAYAGWMEGLTLIEFAGKANELGGDPAAVARLGALYDASIRVADRLLGEVVSGLESTGRLDESWLVVTSDHGEELFDHGRFGHGFTVHEEMLRVPLLLRGPGVAAARIDAPVSLVDVAPTLRELASLPRGAAHEDGRSLVPLLLGGALPEQPLLAVADDESRKVRYRMLRGRRWKWIEGGEGRLYDLAADPGEREDRAGAEADRVERLRAALEAQVATLKAAGEGSDDLVLSAEARRRLAELGYLQGG